MPHCLVARYMHLSNSLAASKSLLLQKCEAGVEALLVQADAAVSLRETETAVWTALMAIGNAAVTVLFARRCERSTATELETRGLQRHQVQVLTSAAHHATMTTTLGPVRVHCTRTANALMGRVGVSCAHPQNVT